MSDDPRRETIARLLAQMDGGGGMGSEAGPFEWDYLRADKILAVLGDQPATEPPAEYEQVGWWWSGRFIAGAAPLAHDDGLAWEPVYRRVPAPTEGADDE